MTPSEEWRPIVGYEGAYEVSDQGRVRNSLGHVLSLDRSSRYVTIRLFSNGYGKRHKVHRLVAVAFHLPPLPGQTDACHNNGDLQDNRAANIRWDTHANNMTDIKRHRTGRNQNTGATHCKRGHEFTPDNTAAQAGGRMCRACRRLRDWKYRHAV